jgi:sortase A
MDTTRLRFLRFAERAFLAIGLVGVVWWGTFQAGVAMSSRHDLARFGALQAVGGEAGTPDQSLWSPERVALWRKAAADPAPAPLAVLRIAKIQLEVPVLRGTDDRTLDRGVGHIEGTATPGAVGNVGIAGHRDSFFRGLKDVAPGDLIEVQTLREKLEYRVVRTWVVDPGDVSVLEETSSPSLTLVTCYPFYFIGSAPNRFIVRALPTSRVETQVIAESAQKWRQ